MFTSSTHEETYLRWLLRAKARGNYFDFFRLYIKVMSKLEALFFQDLINHATTREQRASKKRKPGKIPLVITKPDGIYFLCTSEYLKKSLEWSDREQELHFKSLKAKGFISTIRKGIPPRRYVNINIFQVETALDQALAQSPPFRGNSTPRKRRTNKGLLCKPLIKENNSRLRERVGLNGYHRPLGIVNKTIPGFSDPPKSPPTEEDISLAQILRNATCKHEKARRSWSTRAWADQFRILREELGDGGEARVRNALGWYIKHVGEEYVPEVYSAKSFRLKFSSIESALRREQKRNPTIEITPEHKEVISWVKKYNWPKGSDQQVPQVIAQSYDNYRPFIKWVHVTLRNLPPHGKIVDPRSPTEKLRRALEMVKMNLPDPKTFPNKWMTRVFNSVKGWDGWSGDLTPFIFKPEHKLFQALGRDWSTQHSGNSKMWETVMEAYRASAK